MKRARREESNVWPSKKVVTSSSNANAQWPALTTQPSARRASNSLLRTSATTAEPAALSTVASAVLPAAKVQSAASDAQTGLMSPPRKVVRNRSVEDKEPNCISNTEVKKSPSVSKTYPPSSVREKEAGHEEEVEALLSQNGIGMTLDGSGPHVPPTKNVGSEHQHNIPGALSFMVDQESEHCGLHFVNRVFVVVSMIAVLVWLILIVAAYLMTPAEHVVYLDTPERRSAMIAASLLLIVMSTKIAPVLIAVGRKGCSGIMIGSLTVQFIAVTTNLTMVFCKVPVLLDPFTGARVYLLRWCEWTPLAFAMTFFTEGIDTVVMKLPLETADAKNNPMSFYWSVLKVPILVSSAQGLSTFMGFLFPFCSSFNSWLVAMIISFALYFVLVPRLYSKRTSLQSPPKGLPTSEDTEQYERLQLSYRLLVTCSICWTILVVVYFVGAFAHRFASEGSFWGMKALPFVCDAIMDVVAKAFYMDLIVDVHKLVFDETSRAARRLEELRCMMAVVWDCSSDVIALSVRGVNGTVITMVSPTFHKIERIVNHRNVSDPIVFEIEASDLSEDTNENHLESTTVYFLDLKNRRRDTGTARKETVDPVKHPGFLSLRNLVRRGWANSSDEQTILNNLCLEDGTVVHCETKATRLGPNALVLVMRDISERCKRFEAEKVAITASTERRKDEEANRFTRHEVKNGLLASIGLCDSLMEAVTNETGLPIDRSSSGSLSSLRLMSMLESNKREKWKDPLVLRRNQLGGPNATNTLLTELDLTLRDVLDTVLSEAMARDVIHEVYRPKLEKVDIQSVLGGEGEVSVNNRFPFVTDPSPLPLFIFDLQLLKFVHRNAVSNACKYGKKGGVVLTEVRHLQDTNEIQMDVINLPGENHASILAMGGAAEAAVFAPGYRLDLNNDLSEATASHSSGDGAWISQKCAKTLGGRCSIRFEQIRTIFSLRCPATTYDVALGVPSNFSLPENTWGIAIDDSKIQRKMLQRFFSLAGIQKTQQVLLGASPEEIRGFVQTVASLIKNNPNSYFLLIVDENLDINAADKHLEHTISGSLTIQKLRSELSEGAEERILAVVRSANDSAADIEIYNSRAHGFLYKAPIQKEKIMEVLAPLWMKRFAQRFPESVDVSKEAVSDANAKADFDADADVSAATYVMETLEVIDALCIENEALLAVRWSFIWKKLEALKKELQTLEKSDVVEEALVSIDKMNGQKMPDDFLSKWATLRSLIIRVV